MMTKETDTNPVKKRRPLLYPLGILGVIVSLLLLAGLIWRQEAALRHEEKSRKEALNEGRRVRMVTARKAPEVRLISLVGEAFPYASVTLYAKISGYLQEIDVDKGDHVEADQIVAVIDSPELRRQYAAAVAEAKNQRAIADRNKYLLGMGAVSPQTAETSETTAKIAEENAASLLVQKNYEVLRAPFPGVITARYADPGALVQSATTSQTNALPLVTLAQTDRLRVYVYPDQKTAGAVRLGDTVEVSDATRPEVKVSGSVTRTSGELDSKTRTLLVEIDLDNSQGRILAGSFVQVTLSIRSIAESEIPAESLVLRGDKPYVAVIGEDNKVNYREVAIYESDGRKIRLSSGLAPGERVVFSPGQSMVEGEKVQPIEDAPEKK
jgi:membrane fusion protein, multidrug efflux system